MIKSDFLTEAIADIWDKIEIIPGSKYEFFESELTTLLRMLDGSKGREEESVQGLIFALFEQFDAAYMLLIQAISPYQSKGIAKLGVGVKKHRYVSVPVLYGTDRAFVNKADATVIYGSERGNLSFGVAKVSIPDDHKMGKIEKMNLWRLQFREDPEKHVVLLGVETLPVDTFEMNVQNALKQSSKKEVMIFVHGYNTGFVDALTRAAQIAYDLKFEGFAGLFSWPSEADFTKYVVDETNVKWSCPKFEQFLRFVRENLGAETIHIIAHSMGNQLIADTLAHMTSSLDTQQARIGQVVFAAPDIDASIFKNLAGHFSEKADQFTLYASSNDNAIKASKTFHKYPRAGDSGLGLVIVPSVDTVDVTAINTSLDGHSYCGDNRSVLTDIFELIKRGSPPQERAGLLAKTRYGEQYWLFAP